MSEQSSQVALWFVVDGSGKELAHYLSKCEAKAFARAFNRLMDDGRKVKVQRRLYVPMPHSRGLRQAISAPSRVSRKRVVTSTG